MSAYIISNIHGNLDRLKKLLNEIDIENENNIVVFMGDYADYGTNNAETLFYIMDLDNKYKNINCLMGKHDYMLMKQLQSYANTPDRKDIYYDKNFLYYNGGKATFNEIIDEEVYDFEKQMKLIKWLEGLKSTIKLKHSGKKFIATYGGIKFTRCDERYEVLIDKEINNMCLSNSADKIEDLLKLYQVDYIIYSNTINNDYKIHVYNELIISMNCGAEHINQKEHNNRGSLALLNLDNFSEKYF